MLNEKQSEILDKVVNKKVNIFVTGCGGSGKTVLLREIVKGLNNLILNDELVSVTASTGSAAFNISGTTLHSFAGIGLGNETAEKLASKIFFNKKVSARWKSTKTLIIDEVSMITGDLFDKLEFIARRICKNDKPFGGIQLVLMGDLLQLPPVTERQGKAKRIFEAECWTKCIGEYATLTTVMRQKDIEFVKALTCIRVGAATRPEVVSFIDKVSKEKEYDSESGPVNLYATKSKTDTYNASKLNEIEGSVVTYFAEDKFIDKNKSASNLLNNCPAPEELCVKIGAQVMLIKNLTKDLVNGTVGIITGFTKIIKDTTQGNLESIPLVRFTLLNGRVYTRPMQRQQWETRLPGGLIQASRSQIPLILSWALTIHKSQGQTIQRLKVDLTGVFESGQVYTALSRAVSIDALEVIGFDADNVKVDQKSLQFYVDNNLI